jgi:hypothetical protein
MSMIQLYKNSKLIKQCFRVVNDNYSLKNERSVTMLSPEELEKKLKTEQAIRKDSSAQIKRYISISESMRNVLDNIYDKVKTYSNDLNKLINNKLPLDNYKNIKLAQKNTKDDIDMIIGYCNASTLDGYIMSGNAIDRPPFAKDENGNIEYKGSYSNMSFLLDDGTELKLDISCNSKGIKDAVNTLNDFAIGKITPEDALKSLESAKTSLLNLQETLASSSKSLRDNQKIEQNRMVNLKEMEESTFADILDSQDRAKSNQQALKILEAHRQSLLENMLKPIM